MTHSAQSLVHTRVLLKLSGESLSEEGVGVSMDAVRHMAKNIIELKHLGVEIAIVIGGGNFFRGEKMVSQGFERVTADQMGMLFTAANGLVLRNALEELGLQVTLMSSIAMPGMIPVYDRHKALQDMEAGNIIIFTCGTGSPLFSTDSAAALRAIEMKADVILKASTIDGVYSADPKQDQTAVRYDKLSYDTVLEKKLRVMDLSAICLCHDHDMPVRVFDMRKPSVLKDIVLGKSEGTLISN